MGAETSSVPPDVVVDGIGMLCVRLLIKLRGVVAEADPGTLVHVLTTDPAAPIDLPSWCHLTGHTYLGPVGEGDGHVVHALRVEAGALRTRADRPWHPER
ncbi:sulfurtransferase TusA family protein [Kineosporia succinea]|uniref:tRNA 2-thiouridine synthesizing protein A n=1 Tax=Kineosporia succinea TaxID=84632 RepID=A0ABT9PEU9_9ACTN|nr:sulfurtransferase TusA family protein [Kineosporia succinea]MDP9831232.1 tRNA 2-thiouridine synthesizing protein A [Kineosporia succinea]